MSEFVPGHGLRVVMARQALKLAVLDEIRGSLVERSTLRAPDAAWEAITAAAKEMIASQEAWESYVRQKNRYRIPREDISGISDRL
jgi:hypothetical protein